MIQWQQQEDKKLRKSWELAAVDGRPTLGITLWMAELGVWRRVKAARYELLSPSLFQPRKPSAIPENTKGSTPTQAAKRLVPEPDAVSPCCTRAKKRRQRGEEGDFVLILLQAQLPNENRHFQLKNSAARIPAGLSKCPNQLCVHYSLGIPDRSPECEEASTARE